MTRFITLALVLTGLVAQDAHAQSPTDLTGKWSMALDMSMGMAEPVLELTQGDGGKLTGTYTGRYGTFPITGTLKGRHIEFSFTMHPNGEPTEMAFSGEVSADSQAMKGTATLADLGDAEWTAARVKVKK